MPYDMPFAPGGDAVGGNPKAQAPPAQPKDPNAPASLADLMELWNKANPGKAPPQAQPAAVGGQPGTPTDATGFNELLRQSFAQPAPAQAPPGKPPVTVPMPALSPTGSSTGNSLAQTDNNQLMRIMNGQHTQDISFAPTANGGVQATTMRDASSGETFGRDPASGQWFTAGTPQSGPGMSFGSAQSAVNGSMPSQFGLQIQSVLKNLPPNMQHDPNSIKWAADLVNQQSQNDLSRTKVVGDLANTSRQLDINERMANAPASVQAQVQKAMEAWNAANPNAKPPEVALAKQKFFETAIPPGQPPGGQGAGQPNGASTPTGQAPSGPVGVANQQMSSLGPEVYNWINGPGASIDKAMTNIFNYDKAHPGFMQQHGADVVSQLKQSFGNPALSSFMNPTFLGSGAPHALGNILNANDRDTEAARSALRNYLGYSAPQSIAGRGLTGIGNGINAGLNLIGLGF